MKDEEKLAMIHSLENDEDVNIAIKVNNGNAKLQILENLKKELEKKQ